MKFTQRRIETLECPVRAKDLLVFDDEQRGLGVRVTASGGKSYLVQYTLGGKRDGSRSVRARQSRLRRRGRRYKKSWAR